MATFQGLGYLPGGNSSCAYGVSADGSVVVGASGAEAFRWTASGGMVGLGYVPEGGPWSGATAVSSNGAVVVGESGDSNPGTQAFHWTAASGMVGLGDLPGDSYYSSATGVSGNGSVVVGYATPGSFSAPDQVEAFRWTATGGMVGLGDLPGGIFRSVAKGVSANGSVIVGQGHSALGYEAFRWTETGGMVGLGDLPGGTFQSSAAAVSASGSVVVGTGASANSTYEAFRWTAGTGMVGLGDLPGGSFASAANGVSADGSVVAGWSSGSHGDAFIWDASNGMRSLQDLLVNEYHVDLTGWWLGSAFAISADGLVVVGWGINPSGQMEAWRADLPESAVVPLPGAALLGAIGLSFAGWRLRRKAA